MELHARLVHAEHGLRVVEVRASRGERSLGSALAEAATAQEAEELAIARLLRRLEHQGGADGMTGPGADGAGSQPSAVRRRPGPVAAPASPEPPPPEPTTTRSAPSHPQQAGAEPLQPDVGPPGDPQEEPPADPEDWSQELTAIDLQLRRLGWTREQEGVYLQRAFGHPSRSRLTRYSDVRAYLLALEALERGSDPAVAAVPLRRSELLAQGDALLAQLGWSAEQGRAFLERELQRISRQQLSDVQLLEFNMLLEGELLAGDAAMAPAAPEGSRR